MTRRLAVLLLILAAVIGFAVARRPGPVPPLPGTQALRETDSPAGTATWSSWPQAGHDAQRSGAATVTGPTTGHLRWTRQLEGNVTPGPVVAPDGTIVAASNAGVLHGIDPATGRDRWAFDGRGGYGLDLSTSPAVLPDGTVLWPGPHNTLYAVQRGRELWHLVLRGQPSSPAVTADATQAVIGSSDGVVTALRLADHAVLWQTDIGQTSYGSVAISPVDAHRSYQTVDNDLVALQDGKVAWRRSTGDLVEVSPAVGPDGTVVTGSNDRYEVAYRPDGSRAWRFRLGGQTYSSPIVTADGTAWFGDHRAYVTGIDIRTGRIRGRFRGESVQPRGGNTVGVWSSPLVDAAHHVYWGTRLGHIYGRAPSGEQLFDIATGATVDSYPALTADGLLVVGVTDGRLLGIADR